MRWGGLRVKILAWSFVPTMIILVAVAIVLYYAYQDVTSLLVIGRNRELTRLAAGQVIAEVEEYADLLDVEARSAALTGGDPLTQQTGLTRARNRLALFDGGTVLLDAYGIVVATYPRRPDLIGADWSDRAYYQALLRSEQVASAEPVFSDLLADGPGGAQVIAIAVPIQGSQGALVGALAGMFLIDPLANNAFVGDMVKLRLAQSGNAFIVDSTGRVLYHTDSAFITRDATRLPGVPEVMGGGAGATRALDVAGQNIVASFAPVPGTAWGLVDHESWDVLMQSSRGYRRILLGLLALGVLVPAAVVAIGVRRITRPVHDLIDAAQRVAGGDFDQVLSAHTGDEMEELAGQFNVMAARLQESYTQLAERADARARELAALSHIAAVASQSPDLHRLLDDALGRTLEVIGLDSGGVYLLDEATQVLKLAAHRGVSRDFAADIDRLGVGEGFSGRVVQSGLPLVVRDAAADPRLTREAVRTEQLRSLAIAPLAVRGKVLGTLFIMSHDYREFSPQDVQLLTAIGQQVGIAVENARLFGQATQRLNELESLYHAEQRRADQFRVISGVGQQITSILPVDELLERVTRLIQEAFHYYHVGIGLIEGDEVVYRVGAGSLWDDPEFSFKPQRLKVGAQGLTGWVAANNELVRVADVSQDERYVWMAGSRTRSELIVPITVKGQVFGVIDVQSDELDAFDEADEVVIQSLAQQTGIAIENARLVDQAQQVAVMEERNRLARDLHDAVTQSLFSASLIAETLPTLWESDPAEARSLLGEFKRLTRGALAEMRTLLLELRPAALAEANLGNLLRQLAEAVVGRTELQVTVNAEPCRSLPTDVHVALYRIAQEALNNVVKHAHAGRVAVDLRCPAAAGGHDPGAQPAVVLEVRDDGRGFDPEHAAREHLGLGILRERAETIGARLSIDSAPGRGTRVRVEWRPAGN